MSEDIVGQIKDIKGRTWQEAFYIQTKAFLEKNSEHLKEIERLKAEVERLTEAWVDKKMQEDRDALLQQVERLTKAGDAMAGVLGLPINAVQEFELNQAWHKAKGVQS